MIRYEIEGGNLPVVICYPEAGQTLCTESGAMSWMSSNMRMDTNTGGGIKKAFGRLFAGESIFMNEYTAEGGPGMIAFAYTAPISALIHLCDREPEKTDEAIAKIEAFSRHFVKTYGDRAYAAGAGPGSVICHVDRCMSQM